MNKIEEILQQYKGKDIALYGLSTETERFLKEYSEKISVIGLLDGFKEDGEMYGFPIISFSEVINSNVGLIIVIARPGSCKAIAKRVADDCRNNNIALFDVRGKDLLSVSKVTYSFDNIEAPRKKDLISKIETAQIVSFDFFDTLVTRKVYSYTDVFALLDIKLKEQGIDISDFTNRRLAAEKECSKDHAPSIKEIYDCVLKGQEQILISSGELATMEWEIDHSLLIPRRSICQIYKDALEQGKYVCITTDTYYDEKQIRYILNSLSLPLPNKIIVSCQEGISKNQGLYKILNDLNNGHNAAILHIGDDEYSDIECSGREGINSFRLYSGSYLFDYLGGLGLEDYTRELSDRVKLGLFISRIFNDPFVYEEDNKLGVKDSYDIGYLFSAPMISDFTIWLRDKIKEEGITQNLLSARDGYLIEKLYRKIDSSTESIYFLTSRTAAIRAGMETIEDIEYVDSMKYFGSKEESLKVRYGIDSSNINDNTRNDYILKKSSKLRENYRKYIDRIGISNKKSAIFDFVAKGTSQLYLQKILPGDVKGYYFLQLEPEFMSKYNLNIEPFYTEEEKNESAIFENYYILETLLTSPNPSVEEFDENGNPVYSEETRSKKDIDCFLRAQEGIITFFNDYVNILPKTELKINKTLDEQFLVLINKITIKNQDFLSLKIEDPFFGRMTSMKDMIL